MNRIFVIIGIIILGVALVYLNQGISKTAPTEEAAEQAQSAQEKAAGEEQHKAMITKITPTGPDSVPKPEETVGDPAKAKHHIQVGWVYDETNLKDPEGLMVSMDLVEQFVAA